MTAWVTSSSVMYLQGRYTIFLPPSCQLSLGRTTCNFATLWPRRCYWRRLLKITGGYLAVLDIDSKRWDASRFGCLQGRALETKGLLTPRPQAHRLSQGITESFSLMTQPPLYPLVDDHKKQLSSCCGFRGLFASSILKLKRTAHLSPLMFMLRP